jgi:AraC-like DNA-binding protein
MMHPGNTDAIKVRFALPSERLRPYVTTYYLIEAGTTKSQPLIEDYLHPEWPNLRFMPARWASAAIGDTPLAPSPAFAVTGSTSRPTRFRIGSDHRPVNGGNWGIGLMPLGWAKFVGAEACAYADRFVDGRADPALAHFRPLADALSRRFEQDARGDFAAEVALIEAHLAPLLTREVAQAEMITAINAALVNPDIASASELAASLSINLRSLERLSRRVFGFPPKLLLRRQRFLRSLSQFMLDPSLKWLEALDCQYHDQAHFVRDFKRFMGMSPSAYAKRDKPILVAAAQARMAIAGNAVQGLHDPRA